MDYVYVIKIRKWLRLAFALYIVFEEEMLAVEHGVSVARNPVAEYHEARVAGKHQVEVDVPVPEKEKVHVGVRFEIIFRKHHELFLVLAHIVGLFAVGALHARAARPFQAERHAPARVERSEEGAAYLVVEHGAEKLELAVAAPQSVAVGEVKELPVEVHHQAVPMHRHAAFLLEIVVHPKVVVAREEMHLNAHVRQLADFAEQARVAFRHHRAVFVPEVEHVAQQVHGGRLVLDAIEEIHEAALLRAAVRNGKAAKVRVGKEIDVLHFR